MYTVDSYIYAYMFVCRGSLIGLILSNVLFLSPSPLSFVAAAGWIVVLRAFSMAECGEPVCFWQEACWPTEERRRERKVSFGSQNDDHMVHCPFPLSPVWHTHTPTNTSEGEWGNVWTQRISLASIIQSFCTALMFVFHWWLNTETLTWSMELRGKLAAL